MGEASLMAGDLLADALRRGHLVRRVGVSSASFPRAARSYLSDGTGLAWDVPHDLLSRGRFVIDAEIPGPVRPSLVRRHGVSDEREFARLWTRAEAWAKLDDVPIITWLARHGLDEPHDVTRARSVGEIAWTHGQFENVTLTVAVHLDAPFEGRVEMTERDDPRLSRSRRT